MDETDLQNPAFQNQLGISPVYMEAVAKDPELLTQLMRKMNLIQLSQLHTRLALPDAPLALKLQFSEALAKADLAKAKASAAAAAGAGGPAFTLNINIPNQAPVTLTATATPAPSQLTIDNDTGGTTSE